MFGICTCCESCIIYVDEFDRPDKNQLDSPWMNEGPEFQVKSNNAQPNQPESEAILEVPHPKQSTSMVVWLNTVDEPEEKGVVYRLIVNAAIDAPSAPGGNKTCNSYYFAEFVRNGLNDSIIRLGVNSNGSESILKEDTIMGLTGTQREFYCKIADYEFCAGITNSVLSFVGMSLEPGLHHEDGWYSGMGVRLADDRDDLEGINMESPSTPIVKIRDFYFSEHFQTNKRCSSCLCKCDYYNELPPTLCVRVWPDPNDCDRLDLLAPCEFQIHWNRVSSRWEGGGMCCESNYVQPSGQYWELIFNCPKTNYYGQYDPSLASAALLQGCLNSCGKPQGTCGSLDPPVVAKCSPLEITFGPVFVSALDLGCFCSSKSPFNRGSCNFYVTVYECQ